MKLRNHAFTLLCVATFGLANNAFAAPELPAQRAEWLASMAAESYEKRDFLRTETLCLIAIELDPYCTPARRTLEKLSPPVSNGRQRSRELSALSAAHQDLRRAEAELAEAEKQIFTQQKDPDFQKHFQRAQQAWKQFSHAESQSRAFQSTKGVSFGYDESYLRALTAMTLERAQHLQQRAKAE